MTIELDRKRGRPRKSHKDSRDKCHSYWFGEVFIDQGWAWSVELLETESVDGQRRWQALPLCLGREDDIILILKGQKLIPEDMHTRRRAILASILEANKDGAIKVILRATGLQRSGYARTIRHRQKDARRVFLLDLP